jgi:hypothetical protein
LNTIASLLAVLIAVSSPVTAAAQQRERVIPDPAPIETKASREVLAYCRPLLRAEGPAQAAVRAACFGAFAKPAEAACGEAAASPAVVRSFARFWAKTIEANPELGSSLFQATVQQATAQFGDECRFALDPLQFVG